MARAALEKMGPMSRDEGVMLAVISVAVVLWVAGEAIGVSAVVAAMMGLTGLLVTGVLSWRDCLEYAPAWDTLFWFAVLIGMSGALNEAGLISTFANMMGEQLSALNLGWIPCFMILNVAFFAIHYLFASQTAHIASLFSAFLCMCVAAGAWRRLVWAGTTGQAGQALHGWRGSEGCVALHVLAAGLPWQPHWRALSTSPCTAPCSPPRRTCLPPRPMHRRARPTRRAGAGLQWQPVW